jgi:flavin-dependent dehydrogenase
VRVQRAGVDEGECVLDADLVVDALGRGSRMSVWLNELGYRSPAVEEVKIGLAYTTCEFLLPSSPLENDLSIISLATPMHPYGAFFGRVGGDRHQLSLTSMLSDPPSSDIEGVMACAKSLPVQDIYEAIRNAEPYTDPVTIRFPHSVRRRYERLASFPDRLLVVGDGVCSFNPVYGQGMTVASLEALILRQHLRNGKPPGFRQFFRDISKAIDVPWSIAAGGDLAWPGVEGRRTLKTRVMNAYMARIMLGMLFDSRITNAFMRVAGLVDHPRTLMRPAIVYRVLSQSIRRPKLVGDE